MSQMTSYGVNTMLRLSRDVRLSFLVYTGIYIGPEEARGASTPDTLLVNFCHPSSFSFYS